MITPHEALRCLGSYRSSTRGPALQARLAALAAAGPGASGRTYVDLSPPTDSSPLHERTTHHLARTLVDPDLRIRHPFDTVIPGQWRLLTAASFGTRQASYRHIESFPGGTDLLAAVTRVIHQLPHGHLGGIQLLMRLGAFESAWRVAGIEDTGREALLGKVAESADPAWAVSAYFFRYGDHEDLEVAAFERCADPATPLGTAVRLARFVLTRSGKRRAADSSRARAAYDLGTRLLTRSDGFDSEFTRLLASSTLHRSLAFVPFSLGARETALSHLREAGRLVENCAANDETTALLRQDHLYPALETLALTYSSFGLADDARATAEQLVRLDPMDARSWFSLGKASLRAGDAEGAYDSFLRATACEAPQRARAFFAASVSADASAETEAAAECRAEAWRLDPMAHHSEGQTRQGAAGDGDRT